MRMTLAGVRAARALALALACVAVSPSVGCGGNKGDSVVPEENPENPAAKAKESMDYYRQQMQKGG
ncbi:hypothetical protein [Tautonia sociabilis]|uniref:Secreted protein n=1 Tax=Tautonia sociabilis TaxID=2080755 RepID=A0A432MNV6_9BACT|nr:hypothetical protein [Tautonia sociabilis]RUL89133.1 hypothetical protein TsocGM_03170 [Tautonia sociabilis]